MPTEARPRRSGIAKVVVPFPPKLMPGIQNKAEFWLVGKSCLLQSPYPLGAKLKPNFAIVPIDDRLVNLLLITGKGKCFEAR